MRRMDTRFLGNDNRRLMLNAMCAAAALLAVEAGVPCIAVGGGVTPDGIAALAPLGVVVVPVTERPQTVEEAMAAGAAPVERCGERIARLVGLAAAS